MTFLFTSLVFPVATTWGTFLHAAGPVHVLLIVSALLALDAGIVRLGARLGWTRPVAWLGALLGIFGSVLFSVALLPSFGEGSRATAALYAELGAADGRRRPPARRDRRPGHHGLPDLARREPADPGASPCPTSRRRTSSTWPTTRRSRARTSSCVTGDEPRPAGRRSSTAATEGADCFREIDLGPRPAGAADPLGRRPSLRGRLSMRDDPYTPKSMEAARSEAHAGGDRFDGLHAEANAAVGYGANTLRGIRERYREAYDEKLARWQALRDDLERLERGHERASRPRPMAPRATGS